MFLLSTTNGAETTGLAAFRAVVAAYRETDPIAAMEAAGRQLAAGVNEAARERGSMTSSTWWTAVMPDLRHSRH